MRVGGKIAGHFFPRIRHEAGVGRVVAALREVAAQAGMEVSSGVVLRVALFVGAAACQVIPPNELEYVFGERVEWDHQIGGVASDGLKKGLEGWCADAPTIQKKSTDRVRIDRQVSSLALSSIMSCLRCGDVGMWRCGEEGGCCGG